MTWTITNVRYVDAEPNEDANRVANIDLERGGRAASIRLFYEQGAHGPSAHQALDKYLEQDELPPEVTVSVDGRVYPLLPNEPS